MTTIQFLITGLEQSTCDVFIRSFATPRDAISGQLVVNDELTLLLHAASITAPHWQESLAQSLGAVLLLAADQPQTFSQAPVIIREMLQHKNLPFMIALVAAEHPPSESLQNIRELFPENPTLRVFPCLRGESQAAQNVLLALIYQMLN